MRLVPVSSIIEGSELGKTIYDEEGRILLKEKSILTKSFLEKLKKNGIMLAYVFDEYSQGEIDDVISPELRTKAVKNIKDSFELAKKEIKEQLNSLPNALYRKKALYHKKQKYIDKVGKTIDEMIDEILNNKNTMIALVDIKNSQNYIYQHSVNVAVLSIVIGIELNMMPKKIKELAYGAILHDIGKLFLDESILEINKELSNEEFEAFKTHPEKGFEFTRDNMLLTAPTRIPILEHHERVDGLGYPLRKKDNQIHQYSKIISIVNKYDELTSGLNGEIISPNEAIEYLMANAGTEFDFEITNIFVRKITPYPKGTYVLLSNKQKAVIYKNIPNYPIRPVIKILEKGKSFNELEIIDLTKQLNITIEKIIYNF